MNRSAGVECSMIRGTEWTFNMHESRPAIRSPAGYCFHCGYALNPGTCPECGTFNDSDGLLHHPAEFRTRRRARTLMVWSAVLTLAGVLFTAAQSTPWIHFRSLNSLLRSILKGTGDPSAEALAEITRRLDANKLSPEQLSLVLDSLVVPAAPPSATIDYGPDGSVTLVYVSGLILPNWITRRGWNAVPVEFQVLLDGNVVAQGAQAINEVLYGDVRSIAIESGFVPKTCSMLSRFELRDFNGKLVHSWKFKEQTSVNFTRIENAPRAGSDSPDGR